ncbi:Glycosyl transferase [Clostridium neonatale]|uniref:hypothetical protein n=1 Tax=Clostridium TaxID=1485 RepID=UPI002913DDAA|nr:hypothetical protein [Clostridium sp.]MDU4476656.1 hypothetical protein [Clostridium sp.]CAI3671684.1 Glycosyl transferase [Clostridium neonatale]
MKILILADTNLSSDSRIRRHIFSLKDEYELIVTGTENPNIDENIIFIDCSKKAISEEILQEKRKTLRERIKNEQYDDVYWNESYISELYDNLMKYDFNLIIANDISMVPLGVRLAKERNIKIIADMHEYAPKEFEDLEEWRILKQKYVYYLCDTYLYKCDEIITVAEGIAKEYEKEFKIRVEHIITNSPKYKELNIRKTIPGNIGIVYHGVMNESRHLEYLVDIVDKLDDRFKLYLYLIESNDNYEYSKKLIKKIENSKKCFLKKSVSPEKIVEVIHKYDIGIFFLKPVNFNYKYALPNKFFEFIQARLAVAIGPSIEMKNYIDKYKCGIVSDDFSCESMIDKLNNLTAEDIDNYKINCCKLSEEENYEKNSAILKNIVMNLLKD